MALVRPQDLRRRNWDVATLGDMFGDFDRLFNQMSMPVAGQAAAMGSHPVDLYETNDDVVLEMAVPGIKSDDLDISIEGRQLAIRGKLPDVSEDGDRRYWLQSIPRGEFSRSVTLPTNVAVDQVQARVQDGLLTLTMPKVSEAKARKIQINAG